MLDHKYNINDFDETTKYVLEVEYHKWIRDNQELIEQSELPPDQVAHSFWLSRNRHGAGFFDFSKASGDVFDQLQKSAQQAGGRTLYDHKGKIYCYEFPVY